MNRLIMILVVFVFTFDVGYSQNITKKDSSNVNKTENINGSFFINSKFYNLLEEFIDVVETDPFKGKNDNYVVIMYNWYCYKDSVNYIYVKIDEPYINQMFINIIPGHSNIYVYGGKVKGRHVFLKQKSILGQLVRSEFNFMDKLNDIDSLGVKNYMKKADDFSYSSNIIITFPQSMTVKISEKGEILETKYSPVEGFTKYNFDNINKYKTWIKNKKQELLQKKKS